MVIHKIAVEHAQKLLVLRSETLNDRVTLAAVLRHVYFLFFKKWSDSDADSEVGILIDTSSLNCSHWSAITSRCGAASHTSFPADLRRLPCILLLIIDRSTGTDEVRRFSELCA